MSKLTIALALLALISSVTVADARGGRTTAEDCEPGSPDPDCPDQPPPPKKKMFDAASGANFQLDSDQQRWGDRPFPFADAVRGGR